MNIHTPCLEVLLGAAIGCLSLTAGAQVVNSFTIVNADTDADLATVTGSATVSLSTTPRFNVRANTSRTGSVVFTQGSSSRTENTAPFAFKGDNDRDYIAWSPAPGVYTITAKPYAGSGATGAAGAPTTLTLTVQAGGAGGPPPGGDYSYEVVMGHDGHPDPDDNLAALAGFIAIKRVDDQAGSRAKLTAMIYGDTTDQRQQGMIPGGAGSGSASSDRKGEANHEFFKRYTKPSLQSLGLNAFYDIVRQSYDFNARSLDSMSSGGAFLGQRVRDAIGSKTRVVYSAGGGVNAGAEAIGWLRNQGYSDVQIREHFAIVQHSQWNWDNATEGTARGIADDFVIRIEDQNKFSGSGKPPLTVSASKTSATFAEAWAIAVGQKPSGIDNLDPIRDASDAGSHHFASNVSKLEANWSRRGAPGSITPISYSDYGVAVMNEQLK
jgi:hypothetical protein